MKFDLGVDYTSVARHVELFDFVVVDHGEFGLARRDVDRSTYLWKRPAGRLTIRNYERLLKYLRKAAAVKVYNPSDQEKKELASELRYLEKRISSPSSIKEALASLLSEAGIDYRGR